VEKTPAGPKRVKLAIAIIGTWTIVVLIVGIQNYAAARLAGNPISLFRATVWHLPLLAIWAVATPFIFRSIRRWPFLGAHWRQNLPIHLLFGIGFVVAINAAWPILYPSLSDALAIKTWRQVTAQHITPWLPLALIVYFVIAALGHLVFRPDKPRAPESRTQSRVGDNRTEYPEQLTIRGLNRSFVVPTGEIEWIEAAGDYVVYHIGRKTLKERRRLKDVQRALDPDLFVRVHRSTIAQVARIREMHALEHGDFLIVMEGGARFRLTRSRRKALESALGRSI